LRTAADVAASQPCHILPQTNVRKEIPVTKLRIATAASLGVVVAALVAGTALAAGAAGSKTVPFTGKYAGKAVVRITEAKADIASAAAVGTATLLGKSRLAGKGAGVGADPCGTFGGPGSITGTGGKLNFVIAPTGGSACGDESGETFALLGRATVKGGTGKYLRAKGTFKFSGTYTKSSGAFQIKLIGSLTL
jgi:hypothetical protein